LRRSNGTDSGRSLICTAPEPLIFRIQGHRVAHGKYNRRQ
jgi:hypothetical protein